MGREPTRRLVLAGALTAVSGLHVLAAPPPGLFTDLDQALAQPEAVRTLLFNRTALAKLPDELTRLPRLETLLLHRNGLSETPGVLARLTGLKAIYLGGSPQLDFHAVIDVLADLPNLAGVGLDDNHMGQLPSNIGRLAACERLGLSSNALLDLPPDIAGLSRLKTLDIYNNELGSLPRQVLALPSLVKVFVKQCGLSEEQLAAAKSMAPRVTFDETVPQELYLQLG